jgi:S1-C subfamily serine protease
LGLIPPFFFDCTVAIGVYDSSHEFQGIASGFLYGDFVEKKEDKSVYKVFLVTNRHVLENRKEVVVRFNPVKSDEDARDYNLVLEENGKPLWLVHPNKDVDIAAIRVNYTLLMEQKIQAAFFYSDKHVADIQKMNELGLMEGDGVYVLGFPLGIVGKKRNVVIARSGSVARIRDTLAEKGLEFLVDAFVFPGNSGGPVVSRAEITAVQGTKSQNASFLIGIVGSYLSYRDVAISRQTGKPRVIFEENSGLSRVHPVDFIIETIRLPQGAD